MRTDKYGLLVAERDLDNGDCAFFTFHFYLVNHEWPGYKNVLKLLLLPNGWIQRTPDPLSYGYSEITTTCDQTVAFIVSAGKDFYNEHEALRKSFWAITKRFGFFPNSHSIDTLEKKPWYSRDWARPEIFGAFIRSFSFKWAYPILFFTDTSLFISTLCRLVVVKMDVFDYDDANLNALFYQAIKSMPTPLSWLSRKLWVKYRHNGLESANLNYFSYRRNSCVGLGEMWNDIIRKWF